MGMTSINYWEILGAIAAICAVALTAAELFFKKGKSKADAHDKDSQDKEEIRLRVEKLEGKLSAQYTGLSSRLDGVEKTLQEGKTSNYQFETRVIQGQDKLDSKIEALRDLVIKVITQPK